MKKLFTILFLFAGIVMLAQDTGNNKRKFPYLGFYEFTGSLKLPQPNNPFFEPEAGNIAYDPAAKLLQYHDGVSWQGIAAQFTGAQRDALLALIYQNNTSTLTVSPASGERGISQAVNVNYSITPGNDVFTAASINQGIGAVSWGDGSHTVSGGGQTQTTTYTLTKNFTRNGTTQSQTQTVTYSAYVPQWSGLSTATDFTTYSQINSAGLQKSVQSSTTLTNSVIAGAKAWFITTKANGTVTGNGFTYSIGVWGDTTVFFWRKSVNLTLADGTTAVVYFIRSREDITGAITFIHQ